MIDLARLRSQHRALVREKLRAADTPQPLRLVDPLASAMEA